MRLAESTPRAVELRDQLKAASEDLARHAASGTTSEEFHRALTRRETIERELVALAGHPSSGAPVPELEFDVDALAAELGSDHALVAYRRYERESAEPSGSSVHSLCAFVLRRGENSTPALLALVDLGPIAPIESAVRTWREGLGATDGRGVGVGARSAATNPTKDGEALRRLVLDPLAEELVGASRVVLVLDDVLHLVPFDALPQPRSSNELVGDRLRIETRATLTELLATAPELPGPGELVAIGGVAFDAAPAAVDAPIPNREPPGILRGGTLVGFGPLPGTSAEVDAIAASFAEHFGSAEDVSILRDVDATHDRLGELAPRARWLHVATHGWFAPESVESWEDLEPLDRHTGLGM